MERYGIPFKVAVVCLILALGFTAHTAWVYAGGSVTGLLGARTVEAQEEDSDVDCPEISKEEAESILAQDPGDPNNLDADNDGDPCEAENGDDTRATFSGDTPTSVEQYATEDQYASGEEYRDPPGDGVHSWRPEAPPPDRCP